MEKLSFKSTSVFLKKSGEEGKLLSMECMTKKTLYQCLASAQEIAYSLGMDKNNSSIVIEDNYFEDTHVKAVIVKWVYYADDACESSIYLSLDYQEFYKIKEKR
jgi:hypothetical protein